jgi:hypothetical protein
MMGVCLAAAGLLINLPLSSFSLAWTHSIEKIRWEEDYQLVSGVNGRQLQLSMARIRGSGAGMEAPADAVLIEGVWHYKPTLAPLDRLHLMHSSFVGDYSLCWNGECHLLGELLGPTAANASVEIYPCPD